jgi:transcriptional regulator with XRE-family HTH domain
MGSFLTSKDLGFKLRQLRQQAGITQEQLAERMGVTSQQIQKYESGQNTMNADRLQQFAEVFSVPVQEFFCEYMEIVHLHDSERVLLDAFRSIEKADIQESILKLTIHSAKVKE